MPALTGRHFCSPAPVLLFLLFLCFPLRSFADDLDRDGLDDQTEQRLLEQFRPRFLISPSDCGGLP